jgi:hypothetical protein
MMWKTPSRTTRKRADIVKAMSLCCKYKYGNIRMSFHVRQVACTRIITERRQSVMTVRRIARDERSSSECGVEALISESLTEARATSDCNSSPL